MPTPPPSPFIGRREASALGLLLLVYALLVAALGLALRTQLRGQLLAREAESFQSLVWLRLDAELEDLENADLALSKEAAFSAVLDASRLRGVLAARLFDENGELYSALPLLSADAANTADSVRRAREEGHASALFHPAASPREVIFGAPGDPDSPPSPLAEIAVPVPLLDDKRHFCVAHFWLDGSPLQKEFARIDRSLLLQGAIAFLAGSAALAACLLWALRRLARSNAELQAAREDLLLANKELAFSARTAALGTISAHLLHDLKNPLAGLEGFISDGSSGQAHDGPAWKEAREAARRLRSLVSETLEVMRQECNRADGSPRPLAEMLSELVDFQAAKAQAAGVKLVLRCEAQATLSPRTASLISLSLRNLLANAIDASPRGAEILLSTRQQDDALLFEVQDQGPGIPKELQAGLFQAMQSGKAGGSGLGIALSRHLARHAGAQLDLVSSDEKGTCFRLTLPLAHLTEPPSQESFSMPNRVSTTYHSLLSLGLLLGLFCSSAWGAVDGSLKWKFTSLSTATPGAIVSSPAVGPDGTIYFGVEKGTSAPLSSDGRLYALKPDGTMKWVFAPDVATSDWIDSTPAIAPDGTIVFGCWNGRLYALNPNGTTKWSLNVVGFIAGSPAVAPDGSIYVGTGASELLAINGSNGALKWRYAVGDWIESSPAIGPDGAIYIGSADNALYAINPDGTLRWKYLTGGDIASAPTLAADGTVYAGSRDGILYALNPDGTLKWGFTTNALIDSSASLARDGTICFGSSDGHVYALRPDGTEKWRYPAVGAPALLAVYSSPAVRDDGSVVVGTSNNKVICLNADGTLRWETAVGDWVDSSPLVTADGTIYVGCQDKVLYCLNGTQGPIATDWGQYRRDPMRSAWQPIGVAANNTGRISNMSVRASFSAGQTISVGTWLNGTGARTLLARAVGPTLEGFGVAGFMPDPTFAIYNQGAFVSENDNWEQAPNLAALNTATAANTGFALGAGKADAAVLQSFSAGGYTLEVTGKNGSSGVCLVELYDTGGASTARISNISARTLVGTGEKVLVPGFYLSGGSRTLLIRGIGPSLAPFFTPDYLLANPLLAVPRLRIYSGTRLIAETLAWSAVSNANQIKTLSASVFAFSLLDNSLDAAILVTLPEGGPYTATLDGVGDTTGLGMVEVYELP